MAENLSESPPEKLSSVEYELKDRPSLRELLNYYVAGDSHEHTVFSNPTTRHEADFTFEQVFNYVKEEINEGESKMQFVIFTEHASDAGKPTLVDGTDLIKHQELIHEFDKKQSESGVEYPKLLGGVETSIISREGEVDVSNEALSQMDLVIASKHEVRHLFPGNGGEEPNNEQMTKMFYALMDNPDIDVIGHPTRYVPQNVLKAMNWDAIINKAVETHTVLEINIGVPMPDSIIKKMVEKKAAIFIGTDAHVLQQFQRLPNEAEIETADERLKQPLGVKYEFWKKMARVLRSLDEAGADPAQVITSSYGNLYKWLSKEKADRVIEWTK